MRNQFLQQRERKKKTSWPRSSQGLLLKVKWGSQAERVQVRMGLEQEGAGI